MGLAGTDPNATAAVVKRDCNLPRGDAAGLEFGAPRCECAPKPALMPARAGLVHPMNSTALPTHANADVIEATYRVWLDNPDGVDPTWRAFFQGFSLGSSGGPMTAAPGEQGAGAPIIDSLRQSHVHYLIAAYRAIGHLQAHLDPLSDPPPPTPKLALGLVPARRGRSRHLLRRRHLPRRGADEAPGRRSLRSRGPTAAMSASSTSTSRTRTAGTGSRSGSNPPACSPRSPRPRRCGSCAACTRRSSSRSSCTRNTSARSASPSRAARRSSRRWTP